MVDICDKTKLRRRISTLLFLTRTKREKERGSIEKEDQLIRLIIELGSPLIRVDRIAVLAAL